MPGLFTPKLCARLQHFSMDVLIAHGGPNQRTAQLFPGPFKAEIGHHSRDNGVLRQLPATQKLFAPKIQDIITIHRATFAVHIQRSIGVSIEGNPKIGLMLFDRIS